MKKFIIPVAILIVIFIITLSYIFFQKERVETPLSVKCIMDSDCKLIYNNCDCEAVPINDSRTFLESNQNEVCKWNICHGTNVTAVCRNNECVRNDK